MDVDKISEAPKSIHDLWTLPIQLIVAFALLYNEVGIVMLFVFNFVFSLSGR